MAKTMKAPIVGPSAQDLASALTLSRSARGQLNSDLRPGAYLKLLLKDRRWSDAIRFLAHALPPRHAVWWACLCVEHAVGERAAGPEFAALWAATRWVVNPSPDRAQAAGKAAQALPSSSPAHALTKAAEAGGDAPDTSPVPGKPNPAGRFAAAAVLLAAAEQPQDLVHLYRQFLYIGLDVEAERIPWEANTP